MALLTLGSFATCMLCCELAASPPQQRCASKAILAVIVHGRVLFRDVEVPWAITSFSSSVACLASDGISIFIASPSAFGSSSIATAHHKPKPVLLYPTFLPEAASSKFLSSTLLFHRRRYTLQMNPSPQRICRLPRETSTCSNLLRLGVFSTESSHRKPSQGACLVWLCDVHTASSHRGLRHLC